MEVRTQSYSDRTIRNTIYRDDDGSVRQRLETLLEINAGIAREKALFRNERERLEAAAMTRPMPPEKAFSLFGLMIGTLTPAAIFVRVLWDGGVRPENAWVLVLLILTNITAAITGFFTGKLVGRSVAYLHDLSFSRSILLLPLLGLIWGMAAGAAGGVFMFIIGSVFGSMVGGAVGAIALPAFAILHRLTKRGEMIETRLFLPLAFGVTLTICSFILGL